MARLSNYDSLLHCEEATKLIEDFLGLFGILVRLKLTPIHFITLISDYLTIILLHFLPHCSHTLFDFFGENNY